MIAPTHLKVIRGEPCEIDIQLGDIGSPAPTVTFTLAEERNSSDKLHTADFEDQGGSPHTYRLTLSPDDTNIDPGTYYWDAWRMDTPQLVGIGTLTIQGVVRLP
jgi:hypothetical protein